MRKIYLATPYTGTQREQIERFMQACEIAASLIRKGYCVFSPIAHSHSISILGDIQGTHEHWKVQNEGWLEWCDEVWVPRMDGWDKSTGVKWECDWAMQRGVGVVVFDI